MSDSGKPVEEEQQSLVEASGEKTKTSWITFMLVVVFGMGSWVAINGLWSELFILIPYTNEQYKLTAYLTVIVQIANIGPIVYTIFEKLAGEGRRVASQSVGVGTIITIGTLACILLSQYWHECSRVFGTEHSTALIALAFFLALVDCTSSVVFLPFLASYPATYLSALYVGEGLSGLIPSALALIQFESQLNTCGNKGSYTVPVGCNSTGQVDGVRFQPSVYFGLLAAIMIACGTAFVLLRFRLGKIKRTDTAGDALQSDNIDGTDDSEGAYVRSESLELSPLNSRRILGIRSPCWSSRSIYSRSFLLMLLGLMWISALANGVLPALSSYAYFPYGQKAFLLTTVAGILSTPTAAFLYHWLPSQSQHLVACLIAGATCVAAYVVFLASYCQRPLECTDGGTAMVVVLAIAFAGSTSYCKVTVSTIAHHVGKAQGLLWCGIVTQIGSFLGAIVTFALTEKNIFADPTC